jgi:hypothetical protein
MKGFADTGNRKECCRQNTPAFAADKSMLPSISRGRLAANLPWPQQPVLEKA